MEVFKVVSFAMVSLFLILTVKEKRKDIAIILSISAGIMLLMFSLDKITNVIDVLNNIVDKSGINKEFLEIIIKVVGITYIIEFAKDICTDSGESSLANKVEIAGKVIIVTLSLPLISALTESLSGII